MRRRDSRISLAVRQSDARESLYLYGSDARGIHYLGERYVRERYLFAKNDVVRPAV